MDYLDTYKILDEQVVFHSLNKQVLTLLSCGNKGAWLERKDGQTKWVEDCQISFDVLKFFPFIREEMETKSLLISFVKYRFQVSLSYKMRKGGYKEPLEEVCVLLVNESTIYQALAKMNRRLKQAKEKVALKDVNSIVDFNAYKRNLQLLKK